MTKAIDRCGKDGSITEHLTNDGVTTVCGYPLHQTQVPANNRRCRNCYPEYRMK